MPKDAEIIANYRNPACLLGWTPTMAPLLLDQPVGTAVTAGQSLTLTAKVAAIPAPPFQWFRNGVAISGSTSATSDAEVIP